jgi:hypothetical protein
MFARGSVEGWDGRSREGKFLRKCEAELIAQIGGEPSWAQLMLGRVDEFDQAKASGEADD